MKLGGRTATLLVTDEGREILENLGMTLTAPNRLVAAIKESEDLGLWLRVARDGQEHEVLLFWHHMVGIDMVDELGKSTGLKG